MDRLELHSAGRVCRVTKIGVQQNAGWPTWCASSWMKKILLLWEKSHVHIHGMLVDILVWIVPKVYKNYITIDKKGNKQILAKCLNALFRILVAALLYYQKFTSTLKEEVFIINPHDPSMWNKEYDMLARGQL